jgi:hypothetical protein
MFPITYKNRFIYMVQGDPRWAADKLREHLASWLESKDARNVVVVEDKYIRFVTTWRFFRAFSNCEIMVAHHGDLLEVTYQVGLIRFWVIALLLTGMVMVFPFFWSATLLLEVLGLVIFEGFIGVSILGGVAMSLSLFNQFMKDRLREFFSSVSSLGVQGKLITSR